MAVYRYEGDFSDVTLDERGSVIGVIVVLSKGQSFDLGPNQCLPSR